MSGFGIKAEIDPQAVQPAVYLCSICFRLSDGQVEENGKRSM